MGIWLLILGGWAACGAAGMVHDIDLPWLVTIGCWACIDLCWRVSGRGAARGGTTGRMSFRLRVMTYVPYLLYCLPLSDVPVLGQRVFPGWPVVQWIAAGACVAGAVFGIYARRVLAKNWAGDVAITQRHALVDRGPYAVVRHPIYLGLLASQMGMIIALGEVRALVFLYGIDLLLKKVPREEAALRDAYPIAYERYALQVKKLVPGVW